MSDLSTSPLPALRQLLRERFPTAARGTSGALATGIPAIDNPTGGGLPRPALTEVVCSAPSGGGQLLLGQLLDVTRQEACRVALVDAGDGFDPESWPTPLLEHLLWVRARSAHEGMAAADLLARDANLALLLLDLRRCALTELRRIPSTQWYRLQRALEPTTLAAVVFTPRPLVPSAQLRLELSQSHSLAAQEIDRPRLAADLAPQLRRLRLGAVAEAAAG